jgi:hypothetical protein
VLVMVLSAGIAACAEEGLPPDLARYCEKADELDQRGDAAFSQLATDASTEEQVRVLRSYLEQNRLELDQLERDAPVTIKADVAAVIAAQRRAAETGDLGEIDKAAEQQERVEAYEFGECFQEG